MLRSTFAGFNTAVLGLAASQRAIDVAGQNLSNINTQGYTRQRLDQISLNPVGPSLANSQYSAKVGKGVMMTGVSQIRDPFLDVEYRNQLPKVGTADAMDSVLAQIGQIFDETSKDAIAVQFDKIISALQNLGDPQNSGTTSADTVVRSAFEVILNTVHQNGNKVKELYDELQTKLDETIVPQINAYLKNIVEKNIAIKNTQVLGDPGLELMDARNEMIDDLATYFPIEVSYKKQTLGGGIVVDLLNIDLVLTGKDGTRTKIKLVEDDMCGEVGIARYQDGDKKGQIQEPMDIYFKTASENPKTYGGGAEVLKTELPKEIRSYIDDLASLNEKVKKTNERIDELERLITSATSDVAGTHQERINNYIKKIADQNKTYTEKTTALEGLNTQIAAANANVTAKKADLRNAKTEAERETARNNLAIAQNELAKLNSEYTQTQNERNVAASERTQALKSLQEYFPSGTVTASTDEKGLMTVGVATTTTAAPPNDKGTATLVTGDGQYGTIAVNTTAADTNATNTVSYAVTGVTGVTGSLNGTAQSSNKIQQAIDRAVEDYETQITDLKNQLPQYEDKRLEKVKELQEYFPENKITYSIGPDNIMSVFLSKKDATGPNHPGDATNPGDPILVSMGADGSQKATVALGTGKDADKNPMLSVTGYGATAAEFQVAGSVIERITGSVNDKLTDGVLKGDLDMLNKAEVFDTLNNLNGGEATDTKGIQYYQKMLDTFVNQMATKMNELNALREEIPAYKKDENGNYEEVNGEKVPIYETIGKDQLGDDGKPIQVNGLPAYREVTENGETKFIVQEPVLDEYGDPEMEPVYQKDTDGNIIKDQQGNPIPEMETVEKTEMREKLKEYTFEMADGSTWYYYRVERDENGNPIMEEVKVGEQVPKMQPRLQDKQATEIKTTPQPLFETTDGSDTFTATNIKISDKWMNNEIQINNVRDNASDGNSSDNWNIQRMINAISDGTFDFYVNPKDPTSAKVFTGTLYECYTNIQRVQSVERQATSQILDTRTTVLNQIADDKDSVSGVWMDEEVMSLMKYSQSYNAASRLMTVMDEVLDRLITQTGACGR